MIRSKFSEYSSADPLIVDLVRAGWRKTKATDEDLGAFCAENFFYFEEVMCPDCTAPRQWLTLCPNKSMDGDDLRLAAELHRDGSFGDWVLFEAYVGSLTKYNPSGLSIRPESVAQMLLAWEKSFLKESF